MAPRLLLLVLLLIAFAVATGTGLAAPLPTGEWWLQAETTDDAGIVRDGSDAAALWPLTTGAGVIVAVVDTGVDPQQPDLASHLWSGVSFLPKLLSPPPVVDVILNHSRAWRKAHHAYLQALRARDRSYARTRDVLLARPVPNGDFSDRDGHGTHVAGIIGASRDDAAGYAGVASGSVLMAVQGLGLTLPTSTETLAAGIRYAVDHGARIINLSWGSFHESPSIGSAIAYAVAQDVLVVAAAGNWRQDIDASPVYPAAYPGVLAVAATCDGHTPAFFSDYGRRVDLAAPGCAIVSTVPRQATLIRQNRPNPLADTMSGTSQAAPMVSGVAALLLSLYPQASAAQVAAAICAGARPEPALAGLTRCGGALDAVGAARALADALGEPAPQLP